MWPGLARGRAGVLDEDVDAAALVVAGEAVVFVLLVGELGDDVPRVDQAGDLARGKKGGGIMLASFLKFVGILSVCRDAAGVS